MRLFTAAIFTFIAITTSAQYRFNTEKMAPCTEVKNQQKTGTCWSFATSSFLESEAIRKGAENVDLSEMFVVHNIYRDKAHNYFLRQGKANFSQGALAHDLIRSASLYGVVPEQVYNGKTDENEPYNHSEVEKGIKGYLDGVLSARKIDSEKWQSGVDALLNIYLGDAPKAFNIEDMRLTPKTYAQMLKLDMNDYVSLTSFTHQPYYESFILSIPDNYSNGAFVNLPLDEMLNAVEFALMEGYTVVWDGDVSEKGFNANKGLAVLPVEFSEAVWANPGKEQEVSAESRQDGYNSLATTDDHLMHLVGIALDQKGTKYFIVKNSWGEKSPYKGFLYMSEAYFKAKTVSVLLSKEALPVDTKAKIK